MLDFLF